MYAARWLVIGGVGAGIVVAITTLPVPSAAAPPEPIRYGRDVRPILADRCFICHGPDLAQRKGELRLDSFDEATKGRKSGAAIVAGDARKSLVWQKVTATDPGERMPPPDSSKHALDASQCEIIKRWIDEGAGYEPHWAFTPPLRPAAPQLKDRSWGANDIDQFILANLEKSGFAPSPAADRATLCRRIFLDLTGLPPTETELDAFAADPSDDARAKLIDRLLTQEPYRSRYAERMSVPWLDVARFADTSGIHMDAGRSIWLYRDWVLDAFRSNKPYDQFVIEQLAGDLIPGATTDQIVASGFNRNHVTSDEGGAINEEYLLEYAVDRVATTSSAFLGLSMQCARCHDHKFDPISTEDFYSVLAFFNSVEEPGVYTQVPDAERSLEPFVETPTEPQREQLTQLDQSIATILAARDLPAADEEQAFAAYSAALVSQGDLTWVAATTIAAESTNGATLTIQPDGSVLASGLNPADDQHILTLTTPASDLRLIALEAMTDPSLAAGRVGRAQNGNAVLDSISVEAISVVDPTQTQRIALAWAWADAEQANDDFRAINALVPDEGRRWAVGSHTKEGTRLAVFAAIEPFGFVGGTTLRVTLNSSSPYGQHVFGRVRLSLAQVSDALMAKLPEATSAWYIAGPWMTQVGVNAYDIARGPEGARRFSRGETWGEFGWRYAPAVIDSTLVSLAQGEGTEYLARQIFAPSARELELSLGSDDGIQVFLNGARVHEARVDRAVKPDQEVVNLALNAGENLLVCKVVNTGGIGGFYHRARAEAGAMTREMVPLVLPTPYTRDESRTEARTAWRTSASPRFRELSESLAKAQQERALVTKQIPHTMVMKDRMVPTETFVLKRGVYDQPDHSRPVARAIPSALGSLKQDQPANRLGLAQWITSNENPLMARVVVNRLWEQFFGRGIVRTENDFGLQGEWPTNPELLDWLAVEFSSSGWDLQHIIRLIMASDTYAQSSRHRIDIAAVDPDNRLLSWYPRQRLAAEQIRDQGLFVAGILKEKFGGPSVKPYQPEGLWQEVAMPQSNTRVYERGMNDDLWRRSLYTYWKRASPPPAMLTLDAPTREYCATRRLTTNTPLQALVLWNDEQFVEAARHAAERVLRDAPDDSQRLALLYLRCTGERPTAERLTALAATLAANRARYVTDIEDANQLLAVGESPSPSAEESPEIAAWTLVANAILCSDASLVKD
ncbi:MAG: DUF1553 domain-containing protein [Phycisphaerales bacterium]|nr:DUF1553 domain-containing protein [Phycisphaerales bacterium]